MKDYIRIHPWEIREEGWNPQLNRVSESLFSIGNGRMEIGRASGRERV
jgi:maltose phosphorylase